MFLICFSVVTVGSGVKLFELGVRTPGILIFGVFVRKGLDPVTRVGPTGQAPAKILFMLKNRKSPNGNPVFHGGWSRRLSHTHSYPGCHAPDRLVVALADHGCSQYTIIAAYDYS